LLSKKILNAVEMRSLMGDQRPNCLILDEIDGSLASEERVRIGAFVSMVTRGILVFLYSICFCRLLNALKSSQG
jgi:hypothetical protein